MRHRRGGRIAVESGHVSRQRERRGERRRLFAAGARRPVEGAVCKRKVERRRRLGIERRRLSGRRGRRLHANSRVDKLERRLRSPAAVCSRKAEESEKRRQSARRSNLQRACRL